MSILRCARNRPPTVELEGDGLPSLLLLIALTFAGHYTMGNQRRLEALVKESTHILPGTIIQLVPSKGFRYVIYSTDSPKSGDILRGSVSVGEAEKVKNSLLVGSPVAVLYRNDHSHTLL